MQSITRYKKAIIIALSIAASLLLYELMRRHVGSFAGMYPFAESWTVRHSPEDVVLILERLHHVNPHLFRDTARLHLTNAYSLKSSSRDRIDFYYADRNEDVKVIIGASPDCEKCTRISLVSFINRKDGTVLLMNRDFNWFANRREIQIFEDRIIRHLSDD